MEDKVLIQNDSDSSSKFQQGFSVDYMRCLCFLIPIV